MQEIILSKINSIENCIKRIDEKITEVDFSLSSHDYQDIIVLNLQRACQQSIDLAMFITAELSLGIPQSSVDAFVKLFEKSIISKNTFDNMKSMVGFRNIAVHQYQKINYDVVEYVIKNRLVDFKKFNKELIDYLL